MNNFFFGVLLLLHSICGASDSAKSALASAPWVEANKKKQEVIQQQEIEFVAHLNLFDPKRLPIDSEDPNFWIEHEEYENKLKLEKERLQKVIERDGIDALYLKKNAEEKNLAASRAFVSTVSQPTKRKKKKKWYV